eukprot:364337-Chlamydomonas_euryale.AAC.2
MRSAAAPDLLTLGRAAAAAWPVEAAAAHAQLAVAGCVGSSRSAGLARRRGESAASAAPAHSAPTTGSRASPHSPDSSSKAALAAASTHACSATSCSGDSCSAPLPSPQPAPPLERGHSCANRCVASCRQCSGSGNGTRSIANSASMTSVAATHGRGWRAQPAAAAVAPPRPAVVTGGGGGCPSAAAAPNSLRASGSSSSGASAGRGGNGCRCSSKHDGSGVDGVSAPASSDARSSLCAPFPFAPCSGGRGSSTSGTRAADPSPGMAGLLPCRRATAAPAPPPPLSSAPGSGSSHAAAFGSSCDANSPPVSMQGGGSSAPSRSMGCSPGNPDGLSAGI